MFIVPVCRDEPNEMDEPNIRCDTCGRKIPVNQYRVHRKNKNCYDNAPASPQEHKEQDTEDIEGENQPENKEQDNELDSEDDNQSKPAQDGRNEPANDDEQILNIELYISSEKNGSIATDGYIFTVQFIAFHPDFLS